MSMEYVVSTSVTFDAGHRSTRFPGCELIHGHVYTVTVRLASKVDVDAAVDSFLELEAELAALKHEFAGRDFVTMLPPMSPDLIGLASHVWQRLTMDYPELREVEVSESTGRTITVHS